MVNLNFSCRNFGMLVLAQITVSVENRFFPALQQFWVSSLHIPSRPPFFIRQRFPDFSSFSLISSGPPSGISPSAAVELSTQYSRWGLNVCLLFWRLTSCSTRSLLLLQWQDTAVSCWSLCSAFAGLLHSHRLPCLYLWGCLFLPQFRTWNLCSGFTQTLSRMCYGSPRSDARFTGRTIPKATEIWKQLFETCSSKPLVRGRKEAMTKICNNADLSFCLYSVDMSKILPQVLLRSNSSSSSLVIFHTYLSTRCRRTISSLSEHASVECLL